MYTSRDGLTVGDQRLKRILRGTTFVKKEWSYVKLMSQRRPNVAVSTLLTTICKAMGQVGDGVLKFH